MQTDSSLLLEFESMLKSSKLRLTHVRREIFTILISAKKPLSIQQIVGKVPDAHFVSVYRSVEAMLQAGVVKQVPQGFKNKFELSDVFKPHHHHVTCEVCGMTSEVNDRRIEILMKELTLEAGLKPTKHHFEMYGICNSCECR